MTRIYSSTGKELLPNTDGSINVQGVAGGVATEVQGTVAAGAADTGNPVKTGGKYNSTLPTLTNGLRGDLQLGTRGAVLVQLMSADATGATLVSTPSDSTSNSNAVGPITRSVQLGWNGSNWDRIRINSTFKVLASTAVGTEATVWAPASGKKFRLKGFTVSASAAVSIILKDNTSGTTIVQIPTLVAATPFTMDLGQGILSAAADNVLTATSSAGSNLIGTFWGTEE